jgi:hypothetical protein
MIRKSQSISLVGVVILTVFTSAQVFATRSPRVSQHPSEEELVERFNKILADVFRAENVTVEDDAAKRLDEVVRQAAKQIFSEKEFGRLEEADENFRKFAAALTKRAKTTSKGTTTRITLAIVDGALRRSHTRGSLCPLFPIC